MKLNLKILILSLASFSLNAQNPELEVAGGIKVKGSNSIELGIGVPKQLDAGKITYGNWTPNTLEIVGGGISDQTRKLKFWNEGGASFVGNVGVGTDAPAQKLDVDGLVYTRQGIMFPDNSIQNTAASTPPTNYPNDNGKRVKQPFALIVASGISPTDTLEILEVISGGIKSDISVNGAVQLAMPTFNEFRMKINFENALQGLFQKIASGVALTKFTIYFPDLNSGAFTKTIELRNSYIKLLDFSSNFAGNNEYVDVVELAVIGAQVEIRSFSSNSCFCWNSLTASSCTCD